MAVQLTRPVTRETNEYDYRTRRPLVIRLEEGGKIVKIRAKGTHRWYTVTIRQIWTQGAQNRAAEIKAEKRARLAARKAGML